MKTLTISEATGNLAILVARAIAGEDVGIRSGEVVVALRPVPKPEADANGERMSPREALRALQQEARLTPTAAEAYLTEIHAERLAAEERRPA